MMNAKLPMKNLLMNNEETLFAMVIFGEGYKRSEKCKYAIGRTILNRKNEEGIKLKDLLLHPFDYHSIKPYSNLFNIVTNPVRFGVYGEYEKSWIIAQHLLYSIEDAPDYAPEAIRFVSEERNKYREWDKKYKQIIVIDDIIFYGKEKEK